jgi:hypothetical protein
MRTLKEIEQHYATQISELTENWMAWISIFFLHL